MAVAFTSLPFNEAIRFFRGKVRMPTRVWTDIQRGMHSRAFVVAGAMQDALLEDFQESIAEALEEGRTLSDFRKDFDAIVKKHGWNYRGERGWRSRVIYNTNLRTAFSAGSWAQIQRTKSRRPFLQYIGGLSAEPRPQHLAWDGLILPADDPWWQTHMPPNGWGCKCKVRTLSRREVERDGLMVSERGPDDGTYPWNNPKTGAVERIPVGIDPLWDYNPGAAALEGNWEG